MMNPHGPGGPGHGPESRIGAIFHPPAWKESIVTVSNHPMAETDPPESFRTLAAASEAEIKVQKSRFIALAHPAASEDRMRHLLEETARRYHDARHVCYGCKLGVGLESLLRRSDDGEPSGTAGEPILASIEKRNLTNVLVMVVRYFGGVKLGTGGLARAYGQAAENALDEAAVRTELLGRDFRITFPYTQEKTIRLLIAAHQGRITEQEYGADVSWDIWLPHSQWRGFGAALTETTAGAVVLAEAGPNGP